MLSAEQAQHGAEGARAAVCGEPVKVSTLRTATPRACQCLAGMLRKKWIARETAAMERDARRTERFAVLVPDTRLPELDEAAAGDPGGAGGQWRRAAAGRSCASKDLPSSTLQTLVRRELVRIEERAAAFRLGRDRSASQGR